MRVNPATSLSSTHSANSLGLWPCGNPCAARPRGRERVRPPFWRDRAAARLARGQLSAPCGRSRARRADEVQIATEIVNLGERPIGGAGPRPRLGLRQRSESVAEPASSRLAAARPISARIGPAGTAVGKRAAMGVDLPGPAGVKLKITERKSEVHPDPADRLRSTSPRLASAAAWSCRESASCSFEAAR